VNRTTIIINTLKLSGVAHTPRACPRKLSPDPCCNL
jgi:hypothetical protein